MNKDEEIASLKSIIMEYEEECARLEEKILEVEKDRDFWKHNLMVSDNLVSILNCELNRAEAQGYEWSDAYEDYMNTVKKSIEWNDKYLGEK